MIKYSFIPQGLQAEPNEKKITFPSDNRFGEYQIGTTFLCDVGSYLGNGIIDHHTLDKENECATTLILSESKTLFDSVVDRSSDSYTVITHFDPDFDAIGSSYFVTKRLLNAEIHPSFKILADYILDVDLGKIQLDQNSIITPFSMILAISNLINNKYNSILSSSSKDLIFNLIIEKNTEILKKSFLFLDYICEKLIEGYGVNDQALFKDLKGFDSEITLLTEDREKYLSDFSHSETYKIPLFRKKDDQKYEVDFIITENPNSVLWKYWVRGDREHSENGYIFTCAFFNTFSSQNRNRAIIAVDRTTDFNLKGLGLALDEAEIKKIILSNKISDKEKLSKILKTGDNEKRNRYHREDPWFDERDEFTIIDCPRSGSILTIPEIKNIILANDYWQMLGKKLCDKDGFFLTDINQLFPDLLKEPSENNTLRLIDNFFSIFEGGLYNKAQWNTLLSEIESYLGSPNEDYYNTGFTLLSAAIERLSKIPKNSPILFYNIEEMKTGIKKIICESLYKTGFNNEPKLQKDLLTLVFLYFDSREIRKIITEFNVLDAGSFSDLFLTSTEKLNFDEILKFSFRLLKNNDEKCIKSISETIFDSSVSDERKRMFSSVFSVLMHFKNQYNLAFSDKIQPLSSFDDWKDSIDDYFAFSEVTTNMAISLSEFISKDSSFFLSENITFDNFETFTSNYSQLKCNLVFNSDFWTGYINDKTEIEQLFKKDNRFNFLRRYTKTHILECSSNDFSEFRNIILAFSSPSQFSIKPDFVSRTNLIYSFKIFDNFINRIRILTCINSLSSSLKTYESSSSDTPVGFALSLSFPLTGILAKLLRLLITSQYLPDINKFRLELQEIIRDFSNIYSSLSGIGYTENQIEILSAVKEILDLIILKNSLSVKEYEAKIEISGKISALIGNDAKNIFTLIDAHIPDPERIILKEILFIIRYQSENEKTFLSKHIRENLQNENRSSRDRLKEVLNDIIKEATKDELRKVKQQVDQIPDADLRNNFYSKIVRPFIVFSYLDSENKNEIILRQLLSFSKDIRKQLLKIGSDKTEILSMIRNMDNKKNPLPNFGSQDIRSLIINMQLKPSNATLLPESINVEIYEFLINHFLDKYSIEDAREKINEYTISRNSAVFRFLTSWWVGVILLIMIGFSFLQLHFDDNFIVSNVNGIIMSMITFSPLLILLFFLLRFVIEKFSGLKRKKELPKNDSGSVYRHISSYGARRITRLSFKLLMIEFMIPLSLGILASVQENDLLYGLLRMNDFRLLAILPILISLGYYSLHSNIAQKNENFPVHEIHKTSLKIYIILFAQAWIITVSLLNILVRHVFIDSGSLNTDWNRINSVGKVVVFYGFDYLLFPLGSIIITFISLFVGLFVESINNKLKT